MKFLFQVNNAGALGCIVDADALRAAGMSRDGKGIVSISLIKVFREKIELLTGSITKRGASCSLEGHGK